MKYILGHSSPLMQLHKLQPSTSDFASIVLAENPATIAFSSQQERSSSDAALDMITNARDYWFQILPRTDYDMSSQLNSFKNKLAEAKKRLEQLEDKKKEIETKRRSQIQKDAADSTLSTLNVSPNSYTMSDLHMISQPPSETSFLGGDGPDYWLLKR